MLEHIVNQTGFAQFWARYPRRVGRLAAIREWNRLKPDEALVNQMLLTIGWQIDSKQWRAGYVPHPRTWLSQGRWDDEPDEAPEVPRWTISDCPHTPKHGSAYLCHVRTQLDEAKRTSV